MSYGVLTAKPAQILVESAAATPSGATGELLEQFQGIWGHQWVPGRLTLTALHLSFIPNRSGRGLAVLNVGLADVSEIVLSGSVLQRSLVLTTLAHDVHLRASGTSGLAAQLTKAVEAASSARNDVKDWAPTPGRALARTR